MGRSLLYTIVVFSNKSCNGLRFFCKLLRPSHLGPAQRRRPSCGAWPRVAKSGAGAFAVVAADPGNPVVAGATAASDFGGAPRGSF